jgi:hypothetical protein
MMEATRNVAEIAPADRKALEHLLRAALMDGQQVTLRVVSAAECKARADGDYDNAGDTLPDGCNVYEDLSDQEVAAIEAVMLRRVELARTSD